MGTVIFQFLWSIIRWGGEKIFIVFKTSIFIHCVSQVCLKKQRKCLKTPNVKIWIYALQKLIFNPPPNRGIYSYQKLIFFPNQVKLKVNFFPFFFQRGGCCQGRSPNRRRQLAAGENFFEDRLGYPAISMNFKTESFTYM